VLDKGPEVCGVVTFHVQGSNAKYMVDELLKRKINVVPSYRAFGIIDFDEKGVEWTVRASLHYYNTLEEIDVFIDSVKEIIG
jgi:selenocysteine lyase/cysteine desulfurase